MDSPAKLVLPLALVVTTFASANACERTPEHCVDIEKQSKCESAPGCEWDAEYGWCSSSCFKIEDQQECEAIERCVWDPELAETDGETGGETGGETACHEPFT